MLVAIESPTHVTGDQVVDVVTRHHGTVKGWRDSASVVTLGDVAQQPAVPVDVHGALDENTTRHVTDTDLDEAARLRLHEERLEVEKERYVAGSGEVGKRVETHPETVNVDLQREEIVIERHPVSGEPPVEGEVTLGADCETIRVDLEAERADVEKKAYVVEEVEVGKRTETETRTFNETVGKEVLEVTRTGDVEVSGDATVTKEHPDLDDPSRRS